MSSNNKQSSIICFLIKITAEAEISFLKKLKCLCRISLQSKFLCQVCLFFLINRFLGVSVLFLKKNRSLGQALCFITVTLFFTHVGFKKDLNNFTNINKALVTLNKKFLGIPQSNKVTFSHKQFERVLKFFTQIMMYKKVTGKQPVCQSPKQEPQHLSCLQFLWYSHYLEHSFKHHVHLSLTG